MFSNILGQRPVPPSTTDNRTQRQRVDQFAEELRTTLKNVGKDQSGQLIGIKLGDKAAFQRQVDDLVDSIKNSYQTYNSEMGKYSKVKKLNENLVVNFRHNLRVMVDVTNLLTSYVQLFEVIKSELAKINSLIGKDVSVEDISYLESITQQQIQTLQNEFVKQTDKLTSLYDQYALTEEKQHIVDTRAKMSEIINDATSIYASRGGATKPRRATASKLKKSPKKGSKC